MINKIRALLLVGVLGLATIAGYHFLKKQAGFQGKLNFTPLKKGVDVEIQDFKVVHEVSGHKEWELKADLAQIDRDNEETRLKNVEMRLNNNKGQGFLVSADVGILKNKTKDVNLEGNVRLVGSPQLLTERINSQNIAPSNPQQETNPVD